MLFPPHFQNMIEFCNMLACDQSHMGYTYLERMSEGILLPVSSVIGKLNLTIQMDVNIVQEGKIQRLSNDISVTLGEVKSASIVGLLQTLVELR